MDKSRLWRSFIASGKSGGKLRQGKASKSLDLIPRSWPTEADSYELLEQVGTGAYAVVYKAQCKPLETVVAVRVLELDTPGHSADLAGLVREATLMKRFDHPCVLPLLASFVCGRQLWMVTPFMGQGSIRSIMLRQFPQGLEEVVIASIMRYVLLGLQYVHKNGGIHRDIKADNILISEAGQVCLGDFGVAATCLASLMDQQQQQQQQGSSSNGGADVSLLGLGTPGELRARTFVGTPCWMAPEVLAPEDDEGYDASADIWSFGITLMELALGKPPLAKLPPMRIILNTVNNPPPALQDSPDGRVFTKALKDVVSACLTKDPSARPSATELLTQRFFKQAKDSGFLQKHFLSGVPPPAPSHRARVKQGLKEVMSSGLAGSGRKFSEWLFPHAEAREALRDHAAAAAEEEHQLPAIAAEPSSTTAAADDDVLDTDAASEDVVAAAPASAEGGIDGKQQQQQQQQQCCHACSAVADVPAAAAGSDAVSSNLGEEQLQQQHDRRQQQQQDQQGVRLRVLHNSWRRLKLKLQSGGNNSSSSSSTHTKGIHIEAALNAAKAVIAAKQGS